jgi:GMP synthase-like glutamine amidotransferase
MGVKSRESFGEGDDMLAVLENDPEVPPGIWGELLDQWGIPWRLYRPYAGEPLPEPGSFSSLIVLGGAMGVGDTEEHPFLLPLKESLRQAVLAGLPVLGVCLGGQLLAEVMGGEVLSGRDGERGTLTVTLTPAGRDDPLCAGLGGELTTFQWHDDTFLLPPAAVLLASSTVCPRQAFRWGERAYGLQFHPEVNRAIVATWVGWSRETASQLEWYLREFDGAAEEREGASRQLLGNFLRLAGSCP